MKKKSVLLIAASAVMTLGISATSWAAGWTTDNGSWVYEDSSGYRVYNEWRRGADNLWRYLDSNGHMALDSWVDDVYYVDENGIMASGGWQLLYSSPYGETDDACWYYFQENGKAVSDAWKKISGKWYHFNSDCIMETGWVDEDMYFCGEDGAALTGWQQLYPPEDEDIYWGPFDDEEGKKWYYFNSSGKKYVPANGEAYAEKRIDGSYYCFDSTGIMQTGWVLYDSGNADAGISPLAGYRFYGSDGKGITGWYTAEPPQELADQYENEVDWFYFTKSGVPKYGKQTELSTEDFVKINNKTYLFNQKGNPVYGLRRVKGTDGQYYYYYFDETSRTAVTGRKEIEEGDGNTSTFYFGSGGKGYTGVYSGSLYYMGKLQKAEEGTRYQVIDLDGKLYLVNTSGRVTKSTSGVKDSDGTKYTTNSSGVVQTVDGKPVDEASFYKREPDWPISWDEW